MQSLIDFLLYCCYNNYHVLYLHNFYTVDKNDPFRACFGFDYTGLALVERLTVCMDNDFSGIDVPTGCSRPIVVVSLDDNVRNRGVTGQQVLYCAPPKI